MIDGVNIVALLPMKANSERVKGKNFKPLNYKPLFRWVLDTLISMPEIAKVVINTDAREILSKNGLIDTDQIVIRDRKLEICGDFVSMNLILEDDIANVPADIYLMTHTTNPLITASTIRKAVEKFMIAKEEGLCDSLFSVNRLQTRFYRSDATPINHDPDNLVRTQDLEPWFEENSNFYLFTAESFASTKARIGQKPMMYEIPRLESIDIDDQEDWVLAEALCQYLYPSTCNEAV